MTDVKKLFKIQGPKLMPFLVWTIVYFLFVQDPHGELWTTLLKCAPMICLILFMVLKGFGSRRAYSQYILLGVIFSCLGDAFLNMDLFPHGMALFAVAQICYIFAFGFKPLKGFIAVPLYMAGAAFVLLVLKHLNGVLTVGLPIYIALLLTMCWRSLARAVNNKCFLNTFCAIGSVFFVISDCLIGIDMFLTRVPNARLWIMSTYYFAQCAIVFSTANDETTTKTAKYSRGRSNITN